MKHLLLALVFLGSGSAHAQWGSRGMDLRCDIGISLNQSVSADIVQEFGAKRLECSTGSDGAIETVRVVRGINVTATAAAHASASASGNLQASYSDYCAMSCDVRIPPQVPPGGGPPPPHPEPYQRSCTTSGQSSTACSYSPSRSASSADEKSMSSKVTVAKTTVAGLAAKGLKVTPGCEIVNSKGEILKPLTAVAMVTWIYGSQLLKEAVPGILKAPVGISPSVKKFGISLSQDIRFDGAMPQGVRPQ